MAWPAKDPTEILDYSWEVPLDEGDTITGHSRTVIQGTVMIASSTAVGGKIVLWISGGANGETALITIEANTANGRKFETTQPLNIVDSANAFETSFKAAFPAFVDTPREAIAFWNKKAVENVGDRYGVQKSYAEMLWTAHYLTLQGHGTGAEAQRAAKFGGATEIKSGTLSLRFGEKDSATSGLRSTSYGRLLWPLVRAYGGAPTVTATGIVPEGRNVVS